MWQPCVRLHDGKVAEAAADAAAKELSGHIYDENVPI